MERLNDIMSRNIQRRQRSQEERQVQGNGTPSQRPPIRQTLPEQVAHLGPVYPSLPQSRDYAARTRDRQPTQSARSPYSRQHPAVSKQPTYQQPSRPAQAAIPPANWGYTRDEQQAPSYIPSAQPDVNEDWEDDAAGMRYGDWEEHSYAPPTHNQPTQPRNRPGPSMDYPAPTRELPIVPSPENRATGPRTPRDLRGQVQPPTPITPPQETRGYHRITQPLNTRAIKGMTQDGGQEVPPAQKPARQGNMHEQSAIYVPGTPVNFCPICKGAGYLRTNVPYGHPHFGKPIACECKEAERKEKRRQQLRDISNLGAFANATFKDFNPNISMSVKHAFQTAQKYAEDPYGWLLLIGRNGCGKTHLAAAIANCHLAHGSLVLFTVVTELLDHLRATFGPNATEVYDQLFARMREAELLVLDDLGAQQSSPWANEKLFQLLNYRYNSRFPTIITTNNLGLQGIEERVRSRLMDTSLVITITFEGAQDYRPRNPSRE